MPAMSEWLCEWGCRSTSSHTPDDDGHHGGRERDEGGLVVAAEVDHLEDGERHGRRHHRDGGQPTKLHTAAIAMAGPGLIAFVPTTVAMALGRR